MRSSTGGGPGVVWWLHCYLHVPSCCRAVQQLDDAMSDLTHDSWPVWLAQDILPNETIQGQRQATDAAEQVEQAQRWLSSCCTPPTTTPSSAPPPTPRAVLRPRRPLPRCPTSPLPSAALAAVVAAAAPFVLPFNPTPPSAPPPTPRAVLRQHCPVPRCSCPCCHAGRSGLGRSVPGLAAQRLPSLPAGHLRDAIFTFLVSSLFSLPSFASRLAFALQTHTYALSKPAGLAGLAGLATPKMSRSS